MKQVYAQAAGYLRKAKALVIHAGAGMGVDSGLPDFRGDRGFWQAYPMYERLGVDFVGAANPRHFRENPAFGWGFYGHRLNLYRKTEPHSGFSLLWEWTMRYDLDHFIFTSNVDGQFQKAGFDPTKVCEVHGSIHHLQCLEGCSPDIWENDLEIEVDLEKMRALSIPKCKHCGAVARPNILMFGDAGWIANRSSEQESAYVAFLNRHLGEEVVVIEMGAGTSIPTIRYQSESLAQQMGAQVLRINPRESQVPAPGIGLAAGSLEALEGIEACL